MSTTSDPDTLTFGLFRTCSLLDNRAELNKTKMFNSESLKVRKGLVYFVRPGHHLPRDYPLGLGRSSWSNFLFRR